MGSGMASPSQAYGRLRIDSPRTQQLHHHRSPKVSTLRQRTGSHPDLIHHSSVSMTETTQWMNEKALLLPQQYQSTGESPRELKSVSSSHHSHHSMSSDAALHIKSPPLAVWIVPALLCALAYAFYNIFIKKGSASIHPVLGGVILQLIAAVLGSLLLLFIIIRDGGMEKLDWDWDGVQWSVCAGIAVGLAEMISFFVSSLGVQAMQSIPILIGGSVLFGTILGLCLLGEVLSYHGWLGVILLISGICLVATDPAATGALGH